MKLYLIISYLQIKSYNILKSFVKFIYKIISLKMKQKSVNKKDENQKF
jgi:hypothetical protein